MSTRLTTRRTYNCHNCPFSFDMISTSQPTVALVCPSCHQQSFWHEGLTFSFPTTSPPPTAAASATTPVPTSTSTPVTTTRPPPTATTSTAVQTENAINQGASSRTNSTSKSFLKSLPSVWITLVDLKESSSCSICMEDFLFGASADKLPCKHLFHKRCIVEWLSSSNTCPLCRFKLPVEPRTPVTALPSTPSENNLDGLRVTSSMSPGVIRRTRRGVLIPNTIGRRVEGDRGGLGSNTMLDDDVQRDADGDIIMTGA